MVKARASGSKVYLYLMKKGRQARHCIPRNSCYSFVYCIKIVVLSVICCVREKGTLQRIFRICSSMESGHLAIRVNSDVFIRYKIGFIRPKLPLLCKLVIYNSTMKCSLSLSLSSKLSQILDPSHKTDLEFWDCFGKQKKKKRSYKQRNTVH